jgi:hypothetical protein
MAQNKTQGIRVKKYFWHWRFHCFWLPVSQAMKRAISLAKSEVSANLLDPSSAQFRNEGCQG